MIFETLSDKAYHKTPECPKRDKSSIKSNKRSRIDSPISKEVDAVYAELCDDNMVPKLPDVDPWDEWYSSNAIKPNELATSEDLDVNVNLPTNFYFNSKISAIIKINTSVNSDINFHTALIDSGAMISISHPAIAKYYNFQIYESQISFKLEFANSSTTKSKYYAIFGTLLGKVILTSEVNSTIISPTILSKRNIKFLLEKLAFSLLDNKNEIIYCNEIDQENTLPMANINDILNIIPGDFDCLTYQEPLLINNVSLEKLSKKVTIPPVTKQQFLSVIQLHERMNHVNPAIMSNAIRNNAWFGVTIDPTLIQKVFSHYDCEACALAKRNKLARQSGSQVPVLTVGSNISFDWVPVAENKNSYGVVAVGGYIGYFIFVCEATGFLVVFLTKKNNSEALVKFMDIVVTVYFGCLTDELWLAEPS